MPLSRWSKKHKKTFGKKEQKNESDTYRFPPKPKSYYTKIKGQCRWCGNMIMNSDDSVNKKMSWHSDCVEEYMFIYHTKETRAKVRDRDNGYCVWCGTISRKWDVDHIRPLVEQKGKDITELDYSYWKMDNLQTLCRVCHKEKTKSEATHRAAERKNKDKIKWKTFREVFGV